MSQHDALTEKGKQNKDFMPEITTFNERIPNSNEFLKNIGASRKQ